MGGGSFDEAFAQLLYDLERISVNEEDLERRLALYHRDPTVDRKILFAPVSSPVNHHVQPAEIPIAPVSNIKTCAICRVQTNSEWVQLPNCSGPEHVLCVPCGERCVIQNGSRNWRTINCSICGATKPLFKEGVKDVTKNQSNSSSRHISFSDGSCPYHNDLLLYFCGDCLEPICMKCQSGFHSGHSFETLDTTFTSAKNEIRELEGEINETRREAANKIEKLLSSQSSITRDAQAKRNQLRDDMAAMRRALERKEREMLDSINEMERKRAARTEENIVKLTCVIDSCDEALSLTSEAKNAVNISSPLEFVQFVSDKKEKISEIVELEDNFDVGQIEAAPRAYPALPTGQIKRQVENLTYYEYNY